MTFPRSPKVKTISAPRRFVSFLIVAFLLLQNLLFVSPLPVNAAVSTSIVISQIYGGGGNSGSVYKNDYIELFNRGTTTQNLSGWSVQYASATGTSWAVTPLTNVTLQPGQYYLVQESAGTGGTTDLPAANATGTIAMSATAGKVALVSSTTALTGTVTTGTGAGIVDFIGFGTTANGFEGSAPAPAPGNTTGDLRAGKGCTDTDNNSTDFTVAAPNPRNTASALNPCSITTPTVTPTPTPTATPTATPTPTLTPTPSPTNPSGTGSASPNSVLPGASTTLTVNVTSGTNPASSGITVTADLSAIGGSTSQFFSGSGSTYTFTAAVPVGTTPGAKTLSFTISDEQGRTSSGNNTISLTIEQPATPTDYIVISQIYGGGGNSGATYKNDYVELYNPTGTTVNLLDWSLQYASSTGSGWNTSNQPLYGNIAPGEYLLVALASGGAVGSDLPAPNISGTINMSGTGGKIALVSNSESLSGNCPLSDPDLVDFIGYGTTADCWEGPTSPASRAAAPSNTTSLYRNGSGTVDTNNNKNDFFTAAPMPRRTAAIIAPPEVGPRVVSTNPTVNFSNAPRDSSITINLSEPVYVDPVWFNINCTTTGQRTDATIASVNNAKSFVITPNMNFQPGEQCSVTINKDSIHDEDTDDSEPDTDTLVADYSWTFTVSTGTPPPYGPEVHLAMGNPSNAIASINEPNNYLMEKPEFALSYNRDRGIPNWVSWHLEDTWVGSLMRVDTFRPDPAVPSDWYRVQPTDYLSSGFDRGHMTPNADRDKETSIPINQATFLMTNMVPQAPDNNQGPWAVMENDLRGLLTGNEIYIVSGGAGTGGIGSNNGNVVNTLAGGKIAVPAYTWKVALVIPKGDNDVSRVTASARTIAVIMPNIQGIRNNAWTNYLTTVDEVEALTGYDFFSNVPDAVENSIEAGINGANPPGAADQTVTADEDTPKPITLTAASPNNNPLTYTIISPPAHGTFSGSAPNLTYTPASNYNGADSFTFRATSGSQTSNLATVTITVNAVNDAPVMGSIGNKTVDEDTPITFTVETFDVDTPADGLSYSLAGAPSGAIIDSSTGKFTWTPANPGTYKFTVRVTDNGTPALSDEEEITVTVLDTTPPVFGGLSNNIVDSISAKAVNYAVSVTDNFDSAPLVNCSPSSGSIFQLGLTDVTCNAIDKAGNTAATKVFQVYVLAPGNEVTPTGSDVTVQSDTGIELTFDNVSKPGVTTVEAIKDPATIGSVPGGFAISDAVAFQINTTAAFTGSVRLAFVVPEKIVLTQAEFDNLRILHGKRNADGSPVLDADGKSVLEDVTEDNPPYSRNFTTRTIYARTTSFSPFYLARRVNNKISPLFNQSVKHRSGSVIPVKLQLLNAAGINLSSINTALTVRGLTLLDGGTSRPVRGVGAANSDSKFRFVSDKKEGDYYVYNLNTTGLAPGKYAMSFYVGNDTSFFYTVNFEVR